MGKECSAVCPVLVLAGWELGGKDLDVTLLSLLELPMGFQPFPRRQLHKRVHFKGLLKSKYPSYFPARVFFRHPWRDVTSNQNGKIPVFTKQPFGWAPPLGPCRLHLLLHDLFKRCDSLPSRPPIHRPHYASEKA